LTSPEIKPGDVNYNIASRLSGQKAAAIMMMLNDWVGEKAFKRAINIYLTHNQYVPIYFHDIPNPENTITLK